MHLTAHVKIFSRNLSLLYISRLRTTMCNWKHRCPLNSHKIYLSFKKGLFLPSTLLEAPTIPLRNPASKNPALLHVTRGQRDDLFVYHTKEDRKYYQYHKSQINKKPINLKCIYANTKKCKISLIILPRKKDLIKNGD